MINIKTRIVRNGPPGRGGLRSVMPKLAFDIARDIRDRTAAGRDVDGRPFKRHPDGRASDLKQTGRMVASFGIQQVTPTRIVLAPGGKHTARALSNQTGEGRRPARRWIGVSRRHVNEAVRRITDAYWGKS